MNIGENKHQPTSLKKTMINNNIGENKHQPRSLKKFIAKSIETITTINFSLKKFF